MEVGALLPLGDIGGDPAVVREYALAAEEIGTRGARDLHDESSGLQAAAIPVGVGEGHTLEPLATVQGLQLPSG